RRPCVNHIYSAYIPFQAMQKLRHPRVGSRGRKASKPAVPPRGIAKARSAWICRTSTGVLAPSVGQADVEAEGAIDCGHSVTRYMISVLFIFLGGPTAAGDCHAESLRPVERGEGMQRQPYWPVETKEMRVTADGGRERPEKSQGGR